jgi:succinate dehydrogenase / fumarate reductase membrane anchor subunit
MDMRTPLARVLGLGSAKQGSSHWWWQRMTAIALVPLGVWFVISVLMLAGSGHDRATLWLRSPFQAAPFMLFMAVAFWHAALGLQVVVEDYIHTEGLKMAVLITIKMTISLAMVIAALLLLRIYLGA